jgi:hypothetical protein
MSRRCRTQEKQGMKRWHTFDVYNESGKSGKQLGSLLDN